MNISAGISQNSMCHVTSKAVIIGYSKNAYDVIIKSVYDWRAPPPRGRDMQPHVPPGLPF